MAKNRRTIWTHDAIGIEGQEHMRVIMRRKHPDTRKCTGTNAYLGVGWSIVEFGKAHTIRAMIGVVLLVGCSQHSESPAADNSAQFHQQVRDSGFAKQNEEYRERITPMIPTPFQRGP